MPKFCDSFRNITDFENMSFNSLNFLFFEPLVIPKPFMYLRNNLSMRSINSPSSPTFYKICKERISLYQKYGKYCIMMSMILKYDYVKKILVFDFSDFVLFNLF